MSPYGAPVQVQRILTNSEAFTINYSVKLASGFITAGTAGALVFGHVIGLGTYKGMPLLTTGVAGSEIGSFVGSYTAASDNQTVAKATALCDISKSTLWSASFE
ncbi:MAG: hypothetical protein ACFFG0_49265, partial [Candidatus Thorarchaeota archaeon]